ncbi:hypothetical protein HQ346_19720 [Rhodococcus sp. BP-252]|uniref:hypothetical protein n=1 Tax=unclassified Rhodococcus (in: high G+C Gram-positive bacteria) TaxID=192944 RepID=UPI001C9B9AE5|nr:MULTISPECIES: hypothetical protein [unclassified Rhodococcus (in: high G+C Gram-positive bacteria)]MBY6413927.1 hypothetical protein [Rhodococcus sp. BP-320]MBY6418623.1 hypothetical protein [Rhodococcus sp. BP-321]MBY6422918.1 hypothetical protein [Rhodococcus sp. BP-324]MBY6428733.1 hypothetical protein [Rhodococcus sp. BP-323]MBY6433744.1 hypothetical protein [Rhodococcus sp. BP-322]
MSTRKRRPAFNPNALDDMDDLLPPINLVRDAAAAGGNAAPQAGDEQTTTPTDGPAAGDRHDAGADNVVATDAEATQHANVSSEDYPERTHALTVVADNETASERDTGAAGTSAVIDEPISAVTEDASLPDEEPVQANTPPNEVDDKQSLPRRADARRKSSRRDSPTTSANRLAPPEVALPQEIYTALRALTLDERSVDPVKARSYGQVVLDAVEEHADELKAHWTGAVTSSGTGLFKRAEAGRPTRRRHNAPRARIPLAGVINSDTAVLDQLAIDWGAGSRSALVEQALRLYLRVE